MFGEEERDNQDAESDERPFGANIDSLGPERPQQNKADGEIKNPQRTLTTGEDLPTPGGDAKGV